MYFLIDSHNRIFCELTHSPSLVHYLCASGSVQCAVKWLRHCSFVCVCVLAYGITDYYRSVAGFSNLSTAGVKKQTPPAPLIQPQPHHQQQQVAADFSGTTLSNSFYPLILPPNDNKVAPPCESTYNNPDQLSDVLKGLLRVGTYNFAAHINFLMSTL